MEFFNGPAGVVDRIGCIENGSAHSYAVYAGCHELVDVVDGHTSDCNNREKYVGSSDLLDNLLVALNADNR